MYNASPPWVLSECVAQAALVTNEVEPIPELGSPAPKGVRLDFS